MKPKDHVLIKKAIGGEFEAVPTPKDGEDLAFVSIRNRHTNELGHKTIAPAEVLNRLSAAGLFHLNAPSEMKTSEFVEGAEVPLWLLEHRTTDTYITFRDVLANFRPLVEDE